MRKDPDLQDQVKNNNHNFENLDDQRFRMDGRMDTWMEGLMDR